MRIWANIIEAMRNLLSSKQRTILALIGIIIGVSSVIAMVSIGEIVKNESMKQFLEMGTDKISINIRSPSQQANFNLKDARVLAATFPTITKNAPVIQAHTSITVSGKTEYINQLGVTKSFQPLNKLHLKEGRFISALDYNRRFCVVGSHVADIFAKAGSPLSLDSDMRMGPLRCKVIGLLHRVPQRPTSLRVNKSLLMPISTVSRISYLPSISIIMAQVRPGTNQHKLSSRITQWVPKHHHGMIAEVQSPEMIISQMENQMQLFTLLLGAVGSIALVVGGVGVMNIMLVSVSERRKEIGLRIALGARRRDVQNQFLVEALILSLFGGLFGVGLGVGSAWAVSLFSQWEFILSTLAVMIGFGVSAGVGVFFGYYPAVQASKMDPITALRSS